MPPPGRAEPQRFPLGGPPPGSGDASLPAHDETVVAPAARAARPVVTERPDPHRPQSGGDGSGPDEPGDRKKIMWRRIRRALYVLVGLAVVGPLLGFAIGWMIFKVPSADDTAVTQVATFTFADGSPLATVRPDNINRTKVTLDQVPKHVQFAVLSAEDRSFFTNPGFDITGIGRAVWSQLTGGIGGGSTITQQYVKVSTGQDQFSLWRKYKEVVLAVKVSKEQTKEQILENYLNTIYLGRGAYGIQAASKAYFGKDVQQLTAPEGAMIAGLIQSPSRWDPAKNPDKSRERWNFVLDGMVAQGWLPAAERATAQFPQWLPPAPVGGGIPGDSRGHVYNQARAELESHGITETEINTEGLTITTTIDPGKQQDAVDAANKVMRDQPSNLRAALVSTDPKTGAILAYYGGDNGVGMDYADVLKQPGSSFKPFVLAAALQGPKPVGLGTIYDGSSPQSFPGGVTVNNSEGFNCAQCTVETAMTKSINTIFYKMGLDVGPAKVAAAAHTAGIPANLLTRTEGGIALGDQEVHPVDMASAFATFAADGVRREPYLVSRVQASDGRVLYDRGATQGQQAFPQQVARNVTESMLQVADASGIGLFDGRPVASKTGTVQHPTVQGQNKDAWMVGFTPSVSTAVWVGTDDNAPIKNSAGRPIYGRMLPGSIWQSYMNAVLRGTPREQFSKFVPIGDPPVSDAPASESASPTRSGTASNSPRSSSSPGSGTADTTRGRGDSGGSGGSGDSGSSPGDNGSPFDFQPNGYSVPRTHDSNGSPGRPATYGAPTTAPG